MKRNITINQTCNCNGDNCTQIGIIRNDEVYVMQTSSPKREGPAEFTCSMPEQKHYLKNILCNGVQREHNKKLNNGLPILHKVPPKRDYGRYFCIMAEKGGTSHGGLTEKLSLFFHAKKQEVNAYGR